MSGSTTVPGRGPARSAPRPPAAPRRRPAARRPQLTPRYPSARGVRRAASRPRSRGTWALDSDHPHNWKLETGNRPICFGEKDTKASLRRRDGRMLEVPPRPQEPDTEIVGVEQPFDALLIDLDT